MVLFVDAEARIRSAQLHVLLSEIYRYDRPQYRLELKPVPHRGRLLMFAIDLRYDHDHA